MRNDDTIVVTAKGVIANMVSPAHVMKFDGYRRPASAVNGFFRRPLGWGALALAVIIAIGLALNANRSGVASAFQAWASLISATGSVLLIGRKVYAGRPAMIALGSGCWIWFGADLIWLFAPSLELSALTTNIANWAYLAAECCFLIAAVMTAGRSLRSSSARAIVDGILVGLVVALAVWTSVNGVPVDAGMAGYAISTSVVDSMLLTGCLLMLISGVPMVRTAVFYYIAAAALLLVVDGIYTRSVLLGTFAGGSLLNWGWSAVSLLRAAAIIAVIRFPLARQDDERFSLWTHRLVPISALVVGIFFVIDNFMHSHGVVAYTLAGSILICMVLRLIFLDIEQVALTTQINKTTAELIYRAERDQLTGLYLRDEFLARTSRALTLARHEKSTFGVLCIDIDGFKRINDRFGHQVGDDLLVAVANRLKETAEPGDVLARFGGDEFVGLRSFGAGVAEPADEWAESVRVALAEPLDVGEIPMRVTASVGLSVSGSETCTVDEALSSADRALYSAKGLGRNRAVRSPRVLPGSFGGLERVGAGFRALVSGGLATWYQPIVDLETQRIVGAEALVRLIQDDGVAQSAAYFVPDMIAAGRARDLTAHVLAHACRDFATGPAAEFGWTVSVNVSAEELGNSDVVDLLRSVLASTGMDPARLRIEIDEQTTPSGRVDGVLDEIHLLGVGLMVDDFGSGSSTFGQLAGLAPSALKLDRTLISRVDHEGIPQHRSRKPHPLDSALRSPDLIDAFTRLAHHVSMVVVAEGVENEEQLAALRSLGCDYGQGYLWSKAVPMSEFIQLTLEQNNPRTLVGLAAAPAPLVAIS